MVDGHQSSGLLLPDGCVCVCVCNHTSLVLLVGEGSHGHSGGSGVLSGSLAQTWIEVRRSRQGLSLGKCGGHSTEVG